VKGKRESKPIDVSPKMNLGQPAGAENPLTRLAFLVVNARDMSATGGEPEMPQADRSAPKKLRAPEEEIRVG
jgi:hypothetical protein